MNIGKKIRNFSNKLKRIKTIKDNRDFRLELYKFEMRILRFYIINYDFDREKILKILSIFIKANNICSNNNKPIGRAKHVLHLLSSMNGLESLSDALDNKAGSI